VLNRWYDFGIGKGGNLIDLVCLIHNCEVKVALALLQQNTISPFYSPPKKQQPKEPKIQIKAVEPLNHPALRNYLKSRKIPIKIARQYCKQVWYSSKHKQFFAIGLKNHSGGWELRNKFYKNSSSPKTYSLFETDAKQLIITEGMFDFLSLATIDEELVKSSDCIILNSTAFIDRIKILIPEYDDIRLYLDNDLSGKKAANSLLSLCDNITDCSDSYSEYVDLNEKLKDEKA
jgi:hypothetical protein